MLKLLEAAREASRWHAPLATMEIAKEVALALLVPSVVRRVEIFGSVARSGNGKDLDLIVVPDRYSAERWITLCRERLGPDAYERGGRKSDVNGFLHVSSRRIEFAEEILGDEFKRAYWVAQSLSKYVARHPQYAVNFDLFVFPDDWRSRLDELQSALPNSDPNFMRNISRDAVVLYANDC